IRNKQLTSLFQRGIRGRQDEVRLLKIGVGERSTLGPDELDHGGQSLRERLLIALLDCVQNCVVQLVQPRQRAPLHLVLSFGGDADDHCETSFLRRSSSSSTSFEDFILASSRSISSLGERTSSSTPDSTSSSMAAARAFMFSVFRSARSMT